MRIAVSGYIGPRKTGIGVVTENILKSLLTMNTNGDDFIIFCNSDTELSLEPNEHLKIIPYFVSKNSSLGNLFWMLFIYPLRCMQIRADLSIIPNVTCLLFKSCPTIVIIHDLIEFKVPKKFSRLRMLYRRLAVPLTARRSNRIVTDSWSSKHDIVNELGIAEEKVDVIYPGVRPDNLRNAGQISAPPTAARIPLPEEYLLYLGTIDHPGKNGIALIKAYERLTPELKERLHVVYAGKPGPGFEHIEQEIQRCGIQDRVTFLGFVSEESLPQLYGNCKVFIFPSRYEGFGLPVVEAMQWGAPVITARNSSLIEAAGDAGILLDADDFDSMAAAIERICRDASYRSDLIARGRQHAARFSWDAGARQWMQLIELFRRPDSKSGHSGNLGRNQ
jgi:glycosyltransferase involved in cell wall biosynthesis